jgi:hypothetical protein
VGHDDLVFLRAIVAVTASLSATMLMQETTGF